MRRGLLLTIMLVFGLPSCALAGTAHVRETVNSVGGHEAVLIFSAGPGERNEIVVGRGSDIHELLVRDAGAAILPGAGCVSIDEHAVRCIQEPYVLNGVTLQLLTTAVIDAGDGDDTVRSHGSDIALGGEGADTLTGTGTLSGGPGNDVLTSTRPPPQPCYKACGEPPDVLSGGPGDDILRGGDGTDLLSGDGESLEQPDPGGGNDTIDGGGGTDSVSYAGRRAPVRVDLSGATVGGATGERDRITGVEQVTGGDGADVLLGDDSENAISGGTGDDRVLGRGGDDNLGGGPGADRLRGNDGDDVMAGEAGDALYGGAGDDRISAPVGGLPLLARTVHCGSGRDVVDSPHGQLLVGCEQANLGGLGVSVRPQRTRSGALRLAWNCAAGQSCDVALTLRRSAVTLARRSVSIPNGRQRRAYIVRTRRPTRAGYIIAVAISGRAVISDGMSPPTTVSSALAGRWRVRL